MSARLNIKTSSYLCGIMILWMTVVVALQAFSQTEQEKLKSEKSKLQSEIWGLESMLGETRKSKKASLSQLVLINNAIQKRKNLIAATNQEIRYLNLQINQTRTQIKVLHDELAKLKQEYAQMIYFGYKSRNAYDRLMFLFASDDFMQAYRRLKYLQQYTEHRKKQGEEIRSTQEKLDRQVTNLEKQVMEKKVLLSEQEIERTRLSKDKDEKNQTFNNLQSREQELRKKIKDREVAARKLQKAIEEAIRKEIERAAIKGVYALTEEEKLISDNFSGNKGKLPWPLEKGYVSLAFGPQAHPVIHGLVIKNDGLDIATVPGSKARAVFGGKVTGVASVPNVGRVVIIRHGEYLTVYSNLDEVYVKMGDKVSIKQEIGKVRTSLEDNKTELQFQVHYGDKLQNPTDWLAGKK